MKLLLLELILRHSINRLINKIYMHIIKWTKKQTKKSTKKSLIDDLVKRLLELEFKSNHSIKSKCLKRYCQITKNKKYTIKNKTYKNWEKIGATYCSGCKDYTHNFKPQEIKMTNKVRREKSKCVVCQSSKSRFLKQKHNNKK